MDWLIVQHFIWVLTVCIITRLGVFILQKVIFYDFNL